MNNNSVFFNDAGRIRSGWRFSIFLFFFIVFSFLIQGAIASTLNQKQIDDFGIGDGSLTIHFIYSFFPLLIAVILGAICGKLLENLPFRALGCSFTKNWFKDLFLGLITGFFSLSFAVLIASILGGLRFRINPDHGISAIVLTLSVSLLLFAVSAAFEETFFRGYILQTFARAKLAWFAIILTSVFFAYVHHKNPAANIFSLANTALAGIWLGIAYLKTRNLWFPFGIHLAWNWALGAFFGIEVSGFTFLTTAPLLQEIDFGPDWLTGANYGIEGGFACTVALIVSTILIYFTPFLRPTAGMLELTNQENPNPIQRPNVSENERSS